MPRILVRSQNKCWTVSEEADQRAFPNSKSERGLLVALIRANPGISTQQILDSCAISSTARSRVPSRLIELERGGILRSTFQGDLFGK